MGIRDIREYETRLLSADDTFFANNHKSVEQIVNKIVADLSGEEKV